MTTWLGKEPDKMFNVFDLVGMTAELMVLHKTSKAGKVNAKIMAIKPGKKDWELKNPRVMYAVEDHDSDEFVKLPDWLKKKVIASPEYKKAMGEEDSTSPQSAQDSDMPF